LECIDNPLAVVAWPTGSAPRWETKVAEGEGSRARVGGTPHRPVGRGPGAGPLPAVPPCGGALGTGAGVAPGALVVPLGRPLGAGGTLTPPRVGVLTVTIVCPLTLPTVAVMCAVPPAVAVTSPLAFTLATLGVSLVHVTCTAGNTGVVPS
jgi:hypothetical protein